MVDGLCVEGCVCGMCGMCGVCGVCGGGQEYMYAVG